MKALDVYLDTCAILDLVQQPPRVAESQVESLRERVKHGSIRIVLSITSVAELLGKFPCERTVLEEQLCTIRKITDTRRFIADHAELLKARMFVCVNGGTAPPPFYRGDLIWQLLDELATPDSQRDAELLQVMREARARAQGFAQTMQAIYTAEAALWKKNSCRDPRSNPPRFADEWPRVSRSIARGLGSAIGIHKTLSDEEVDRMLGSRTIRVAVGYLASRIYAGVFLKRTRSEGDWGDLLHTISASLCDVLVTPDGRFREVLARIPGVGFKITDLDGLLSDTENR